MIHRTEKAIHSPIRIDAPLPIAPKSPYDEPAHRHQTIGVPIHMAIVKQRPVNRGLSPRTLFVVAAGAAFFGLVALVRGGRTSKVDHTITTKLQAKKAPWFSRLMHLVSWNGFPPQSRILPLAIPAAIAFAGFPLEALFQLLGWGTSALSGITKFLMRRPRPSHPEILV